MVAGVKTDSAPPPGLFSGPRERRLVFGLSLLAAIHVFIFSAAFPFFNNVDEQAHFDLAVKYSHGEPPRGLEFYSAESLQSIAIFTSQEFLTSDPEVPPPIWRLPPQKIAAVLEYREAGWRNLNQEAAQPPLYYALAGVWWRLEKLAGLDGGLALYGLRFLNILPVAGLVWLGYLAARLVFPAQQFVRLSVPALIAVLPQSAFYGIQNDVLSPVTCGAAFLLLARLFCAERPSVKRGLAAGLALGAVFLTKSSNLPFLAVSAAFVLCRAGQVWRTGKWRLTGPALLALGLGSLLPITAWLAWCRTQFGDFAGTAAKILFLGWTARPMADWFQHPLFSPPGFWFFLRGNLSTLWQGELFWHRQPLAIPVVGSLYVFISLALLGVALYTLLKRGRDLGLTQHAALWFSFLSLAATFAFLALLSVKYDFHDCAYPSRAHPFFVSGRLMLGALIPFLLLLGFGLDQATRNLGGRAKYALLAGGMIVMLAAEIMTDRPVFSSAYNWFHL
jgi:hypothetical protein